MSLDFPFFASSAFENVASILHYINVSILFFSITNYTRILPSFTKLICKLSRPDAPDIPIMHQFQQVLNASVKNLCFEFLIITFGFYFAITFPT